MWLLVLACAERAERLDRPEELLARLEAGEGPPVEAAVLGPAGRELRALSLQAEEPEEAWSALAGFDPGGVDAAWRVSHGDPSPRLLLAEALRRELERPTLAASSEWEGLGGRRERLVRAAEVGLSQDPVLAERVAEGLEAWELVDLLEGEPDPFGEAAMLELEGLPELPRLSEAWEERLDGRAQLDLLREAAHWLPSGEAARLLGLVASPVHAYGPGPFTAGQRGEPADVLRYGGGSPGATAVAALLLAESSGVELSVQTDGHRLRLASGGLEVWVGACGPGVAPGRTALEELGLDAALELAAAERVVGAMEAGELERALELSEELVEAPPEYRSAHAALLACQGILQPGLSRHEASLALAWTEACASGLEARLVALHPDLKPAPEPGIPACSRPWSPAPIRVYESSTQEKAPSE